MVLNTFFYKIMAFQTGNFSFSEILFSHLGWTLARKLMKRPAVLIIYFQRQFQIVHVYQLLQSEYFFQKFYDRFNWISIFFNFKPLLGENVLKDLLFLWHIFQVPVTMYTLINFSHLKIFTKKIAALSKFH